MLDESTFWITGNTAASALTPALPISFDAESVTVVISAWRKICINGEGYLLDAETWRRFTDKMAGMGRPVSVQEA
jgi:hypothetical protein